MQRGQKALRYSGFCPFVFYISVENGSIPQAPQGFHSNFPFGKSLEIAPTGLKFKPRFNSHPSYSSNTSPGFNTCACTAGALRWIRPVKSSGFWAIIGNVL